MLYECIIPSHAHHDIRDQPAPLCKIAVHTLERQFGNVSEIHVVFYLQIQGDKSLSRRFVASNGVSEPRIHAKAGWCMVSDVQIARCAYARSPAA